MQNTMTIGANNLTFLHLFLHALKANRPTETAYSECFIITVLMVKIKYDRVGNTTLHTPIPPFVFRKPLGIMLYQRLLC